MPDETNPKDIETILSRLKNEWRELADLLTTQDKSQDRVIEVEKILLRDASGQYRGKISANPDGSADLLLGGNEGKAWARLGVNRDGEAFLELKDKQGESSFKCAVGAPYPGAEPGPAATPADAPIPPSPQPLMPVEAEAAPLAESGPGSVPPTPDYTPPDLDADSEVFDRLEKLTRRQRRQKFYWAFILVILGVVLGTQAYVIWRPETRALSVESLAVRDPNGKIRAFLGVDGDKVWLHLWDPRGYHRATLGLGSEGTPYLAFYDRNQRVRAELNLGPDGEPKFTLRDKVSLESPKEPKPPDDAAPQRPSSGTGLGPEAGALPSPPAGPGEAVSPHREAEAEVEVVGSKTSNKYHYPTCKYVKGISPRNLTKFKSVPEAQTRGYVPCPVCKPPPLSGPASPAP
jgi:hypothetical protein